MKHYELRLSYNKTLKADILEHVKESSKGTVVYCTIESCERVKTIATLKELHEFMMEHRNDKFTIEAGN